MNETNDELKRNEEHARKMQLRKAAFDASQSKATDEKGLIIVHTGAGKGKSTAALGMIFRALGHGMRVGVVQFTKGAIETGEMAFARELGERIDFQTTGEGYTWETQNRERDCRTAREGWRLAEKMLENPDYDLVVLDELNIVLKFDYLPLADVLAALGGKRPDLHVVITGRAAKDELIEMADLVTEMKLIKHPYRAQGIKAQKGIEF
ncbi:MAG TPA: cob(I)yrinic acid a,c-diamide adenosyltransferase [Pyrinomonadaceae bacterium]|nr:cob(I)yrinic acid a,c-diamide adenosyltransferase [Pyrinomonadaceae bacterium]